MFKALKKLQRGKIMPIRIDPEGRYKFIQSLNEDNTVVLAERRDNSEKCVLREVSRSGLKIYQKIYLHPNENVEAVHNIFRVRSGYIAECEFCGGVTLYELMKNDPLLIQIGITQIAGQLCDAARHFYSLGLVHRDITPGNIIVDFGSLDKKLDLKLVDFDISRRHYGDKPHDTGLFGTVGYAAPEQYGFEETDFPADIYAVGRVIGDLLKAADYPPELQRMWEYVIQKCTMYSPKDRYRSYETMKRDIVKIWQYKKALLAAYSGEYLKALKMLFASGKLGGQGIEDDFLII